MSVALIISNEHHSVYRYGNINLVRLKGLRLTAILTINIECLWYLGDSHMILKLQNPGLLCSTTYQRVKITLLILLSRTNQEPTGIVIIDNYLLRLTG